jgi:hypothetical protein
MEPKIMTLDKAETVVDFPEFALVLIWQSWLCFTDIDLDALEYLIKRSSRILLPNVKELSVEKIELLKGYQGYLEIGVKI